MSRVRITLHAPMRLTELDAILADVNRIILGKERPIRLAIACLLARGHLLIEDLPGAHT